MDGIDHLIGAGSGGGLGALVAWVHKFFADRKLEEMDKRISEGELYAARTFVTQAAMKEAITPVVSQLVRMEGKIDDMAKTKADKS